LRTGDADLRLYAYKQFKYPVPNVLNWKWVDRSFPQMLCWWSKRYWCLLASKMGGSQSVFQSNSEKKNLLIQSSIWKPVTLLTEISWLQIVMWCCLLMYVCLYKTNILRHWNITPLALIRASVWNAHIVLSTQTFFVSYELFLPYPEYLITDIFCLLKMTPIRLKFSIPYIKYIVFTIDIPTNFNHIPLMKPLWIYSTKHGALRWVSTTIN
jgi:hypothetical protein